VNFFTRVDSTGVVEQHIKQVLRLEDDEAKQLMGEYREIRKDLVDRLSRLPQGTFTSQHLRGVLAQVNGAIEAMNAHIGGSTVKAAYRAALKGVEGLIKEIKTFDSEFSGAVTPINLNAVLIAHDTSNLLVTKYETNLDQYGNGLLTQITNGLFSAAAGEASYSEVVGRISQFFTGKEWELHRIVRTELHHVYNTAKVNGLKEIAEEVDDMQKTLIHPLDARTGEDSEYAASLNMIVDIDKPFVYTWRKKVREYMAPPDRPNDRSILVPYRASWGDVPKYGATVGGWSLLPGKYPAA
jgi:hypothetical protein